MSKFRKFIIFTIYQLVAIIFLLIIIEGLSSITLIAYTIWRNSRQLAERIHTQYDETLGWVNIPNLDIRNMYGRGRYLKINGQGFRSNYNFNEKIAPDKLRIICSGDSFTLGFGVDNDHTWCQQLVSINPKLETVNMGQGGYALDQAYLWYKRDGIKLDHDIHILAFITEDFYRMRADTFGGYGKPVLDLKDGTLVTKNVPIPKPSSLKIWLNRNKDALSNLISIQLFKKLFPSSNFTKVAADDGKLKEISLKIFQDLSQVNKNKNSIFILVYLPSIRDSYSDSAGQWRQFVNLMAKEHNLLFIDLIPELRKLDYQTIDRMFIKRSETDYPLGSGHYNEKGNTFIAKILYDKLLAIPEVLEKMKEKHIDRGS